MLTGLTLRNFKCFEEAEMPLGRITVLIGENGTGKSSVLQALALLRQSLGQGELVYVGPLVDLASFSDVVFGQDLNRSLGIFYSSLNTLENQQWSYAYELTSGQRLERLTQSWRYGPWTEQVSWSIDGSRPTQVRQLGLDIDLEGVHRIGQHVSIVREASSNENQHTRMMASSILNSPSRDIGSWRYTPVSKGFTRSSYQLLDTGIDELTSNMDAMSLASGLATTIAYDDSVRDQISNWMVDITGVEIDARVATGIRTFVRSRRPGARIGVPISHEGFGSSQLTFMLFQLAKTPSGGLDMIEEPELHLHPAAIAKLADLLCKESQGSDKQIMLTTHSEHLLLGLLNNVAEGNLPATDLVVLNTSLSEDGAQVERVPITEDGMAEGGLPGFFDATLAAQRRHLEALSRRQ